MCMQIASSALFSGETLARDTRKVVAQKEIILPTQSFQLKIQQFLKRTQK